MSYPDPIYIAHTASTNTSLAELCDNGSMPNLSSVYTSFQTDGKGQRGNKWESEDGKNLLFSVVIFPERLMAKHNFILSQTIVLGLFETLSAYTDGISIKWPNDIYWKDKKICGTLMENDLKGMYIERSISGSGMNLNQKEFRSDAPNPVSLLQITGEKYDVETVLHKTLHAIEKYYNMLINGDKEEIREKYFNAIYRKRGKHLYKDGRGTFEAEIVGIEEDGRLVLQDKKGNIRKYLFKEVSYII